MKTVRKKRVTQAFAIACADCDVEPWLSCNEEAILIGWTGVVRDRRRPKTDGVWWTHIGICPDCRDDGTREFSAPPADSA